MSMLTDAHHVFQVADINLRRTIHTADIDVHEIAIHSCRNKERTAWEIHRVILRGDAIKKDGTVGKTWRNQWYQGDGCDHTKPLADLPTEIQDIIADYRATRFE